MLKIVSFPFRLTIKIRWFAKPVTGTPAPATRSRLSALLCSRTGSVASVGYGGNLFIRNAATGTPIFHQKLSPNTLTYGVSWSPDGK